MPAQPPLPPLLEPYLDLLPKTPGFLAEVTSTLSTSTNWLLLRFIHTALRRPANAGENGLDSRPTRVVLVSWLREEGWWRDAGRKLVRY